MKKVLLLMVAVALVASANAELVTYDYTDAAGADPQAQGWYAYNLGLNGYASGGDYTGGGWVITDGTSSTGVAYEQSLAAETITSFTLTADVTWLPDVYNDAGIPIEDWHRTNNNNTGYGFWVENSTAGYMYYLRFIVDGEDLYVLDGTTTQQLTTDGSAYNSAKAITLTGDATSATLTVGSTAVTVDVWGTGLGYDRVLFGQNQGLYMGTTETRAYTFESTTIPEPATLALLGLGSLTVLRRRRA